MHRDKGQTRTWFLGAMLNANGEKKREAEEKPPLTRPPNFQKEKLGKKELRALDKMRPGEKRKT